MDHCVGTEECCQAESTLSACVREHGVPLTLGLPLSFLSAPDKKELLKCAQEACGIHLCSGYAAAMFLLSERELAH